MLMRSSIRIWSIHSSTLRNLLKKRLICFQKWTQMSKACWCKILTTTSWHCLNWTIRLNIDIAKNSTVLSSKLKSTMPSRMSEETSLRTLNWWSKPKMNIKSSIFPCTLPSRWSTTKSPNFTRHKGTSNKIGTPKSGKECRNGTKELKMNKWEGLFKGVRLKKLFKRRKIAWIKARRLNYKTSSAW